MAIFGNLSDIALVDVFRVLRSKTGTLLLADIPGVDDVTIDLHHNHAVAMTVGGQPIDRREQAAEQLRHLLERSEGTFAFKPLIQEQDSRTFLLPLHPILHQAAQVEAIPDSELPHPDTRFSVTADLPPVPSALSLPWSRLLPLLHSGTSATQAAHVLGAPVRDMQILLYRCRSTGLIALSSTAPGASGTHAVPAAAISRETHSMLRRFMHRLRGRSVT